MMKMNSFLLETELRESIYRLDGIRDFCFVIALVLDDLFDVI